MSSKLVLTREISPLPERHLDAHKGDVGRIAIIGGCCDEVAMVGAPALAAMAALRSGAGLVQVLVPEQLRAAVATLTPCATTRTLPTDGPGLLQAVAEFGADVVAIGPGLGQSLTGAALLEFMAGFGGPIVVDADGLNLLAAAAPLDVPRSQRMVLTPHAGEANRLLAARGVTSEPSHDPDARRDVARRLVDAYGGTVVLKGPGTIVTDGSRIYVNETGNAGLATGGTGDVLTGMIAALMGQNMAPLEASILAVFLHGLAADFAAEELGRHSMIATDLVEYLPEAFREHETSAGG